MRTKLTALMVLLGTCCVAGCWVPEKFVATLIIDKNQHFRFSYTGTMAFAPALGEIAQRGALSARDEMELKEAAAGLLDTPGMQSAVYAGAGRYTVRYQQSGPIRSGDEIFLDLLQFRIEPNGHLTVMGPDLSGDVQRELSSVRLSLDGTLRVNSELPVLTSNASSKGALEWHVTLNQLQRPILVLQGTPSPEHAHFAEINELIRTVGVRFGEAGHDVMRRYLANGGDPKTRLGGSWSLLNVAARNGYRDVVDLLLARGVDINSREDDGTPLYWAIASQQTAIALYLIERGADINRAKSGGWKPVDVAKSELDPDDPLASDLIAALLGKAAPLTARAVVKPAPTPALPESGEAYAVSSNGERTRLRKVESSVWIRFGGRRQLRTPLTTGAERQLPALEAVLLKSDASSYPIERACVFYAFTPSDGRKVAEVNQAVACVVDRSVPGVVKLTPATRLPPGEYAVGRGDIRTLGSEEKVDVFFFRIGQ